MDVKLEVLPGELHETNTKIDLIENDITKGSRSFRSKVVSIQTKSQRLLSLERYSRDYNLRFWQSFCTVPSGLELSKKKRKLRNGLRVSDDLIWEDRQKKKKLRLVMKDAFEAGKRRRFHHGKLYIDAALHQA